MPLEGIDDIHSGDSFSSGVLSVGDSISDNLLEERSEDSSGVIIDERGDSLDTTSSAESSDSGSSDTINSGSSGLSGVSLATSFANTFHSFTFSDHFFKIEFVLCSSLSSLFIELVGLKDFKRLEILIWGEWRRSIG